MQQDRDVTASKAVRWRRSGAVAGAVVAGLLAVAGPLTGPASATVLRPVPTEVRESTTTTTVVDRDDTRPTGNRWSGNRWSGNRWSGNRWSDVGAG